MSQSNFYPILVVQDLKESINFYEDFFSFVPEQEMECFAVLQHKINPSVRIGFITEDHTQIPQGDRNKPVQGLMLNFQVENVYQAYEDIYLEGLDLEGEPRLAPCGRRHFYVRDPNGILIDVMESYDPFQERNDNDEDYHNEPMQHIMGLAACNMTKN